MRNGRRTLPVHRHAVPQMLVDAALVAMAYLFAFELRFDSGTPLRYQHLFHATLPWVVGGTLVLLVLAGVYRRETRFTGRRDYEALVRGIVIAAVVTMGAVVLIHPVEITAANGTRAAVGMPAGVMALFLLLALLLPTAASATMLEQMSVEQLARHATLIVEGTVVSTTVDQTADGE
ncbi:MAG: hypothetical protein WCJ63_05420, partial [Actinomycetes bacterium]